MLVFLWVGSLGDEAMPYKYGHYFVGFVLLAFFGLCHMMVQPYPKPHQNRIETLFYAFYSMPCDVVQQTAANML